MTDKRKKRARALQERTGWSYSECLRVLEQRLSPEALDALIAIRGGEKPKPPTGAAS